MSDIEQMYRARYDLANMDVSKPKKSTQSEAVMKELEPLTESQLVRDPYFQSQAKIMYDKTREASAKKRPVSHWEGVANRHSVLDDPVDIAQWAVGEISWFRNNDAKMMMSIAKMERADPDLLLAMNNVNTMYSQTPDTGRQVARAVYQGLASPSTLIGVSAIAKVATAGTVGRQLASTQLQRFAQQILKKRAARMAATGAVMSAEGAAFSGGMTYGQERLKSEATGEPINADNVRNAAIGGAVITPMLGGAVMGGYKGTQQLVQRFKVWRGEGEYGGNSFTDSQAAANAYAANHENGSVRQAEIEALSPAVIESHEISGAELAEELDLGGSFGDEVKTAAEWLEQKEVIEAIEQRGIDMVAYPERAPNMTDDLGEIEDVMSSLDREGIATSYKTFGQATVKEVQP